jgi:hypothetical protein
VFTACGIMHSRRCRPVAWKRRESLVIISISQLYFGKELYMFRTDLLPIIRSLNTVFTSTGICHTSYVDSLLARSGWPDLASRQST